MAQSSGTAHTVNLLPVAAFANGNSITLIPVTTITTCTSPEKLTQQQNNYLLLTTSPSAAGATFTTSNASNLTPTPPLRPMKKIEPASPGGNSQTSSLRCKRRLDFSKFGLEKPRPAAVARRNQRERNRVRLINHCFHTLRDHVPNSVKNKKLSKVETLRSAAEYIKQLQDLLDENDAVNAAFSQGHASVSSCHSPGSSQESRSPAPSETSDSEAHFSPEEEDLLDFASWFE
ncbi:achaete-scute homolog 1a [Lingula anatina]|uniref:Achaete-scute homolog 1a n=1 Tax=Lingula anatina TaxID=7574 RepID=A0A1S3JWR5_LINAN|nr:achaete-scute homolog 1a [Lingula anatina]|eukprot:XP_013414747.1 achaete-scute homolog 1a [Lingula anatina]